MSDKRAAEESLTLEGAENPSLEEVSSIGPTYRFVLNHEYLSYRGRAPPPCSVGPSHSATFTLCERNAHAAILPPTERSCRCRLLFVSSATPHDPSHSHLAAPSCLADTSHETLNTPNTSWAQGFHPKNETAMKKFA